MPNFASNLNLESKELIQVLINKIISLEPHKNNTDEIDILKTACSETNIKMQCVFQEDLSNIFLFLCQIILNKNILIVSASGESKEDSYRNAALKFIKYAYFQKGLPFPTSLLGNVFVQDLKDNVDGIGIVEGFVIESQNYFKNTGILNNIDNYEKIKEYFLSDSKITLSESYNMYENEIVCSIFINENYLLQQGKGETKELALDNAILKLFNDYSIISNINENNHTNSESLIGKRKIIQQVSKKFKENKIDSSPNYWVIIEKCLTDLDYNINFSFKNDLCIIKINNVEMLEVKGKNEYCARISACRKLVDMFSNENRSWRREKSSKTYHENSDSIYY